MIDGGAIALVIIIHKYKAYLAILIESLVIVPSVKVVIFRFLAGKRAPVYSDCHTSVGHNRVFYMLLPSGILFCAAIRIDGLVPCRKGNAVLHMNQRLISFLIDNSFRLKILVVFLIRFPAPQIPDIIHGQGILFYRPQPVGVIALGHRIDSSRIYSSA